MNFLGGVVNYSLDMVIIYALFDQYGMHYYINMICYLSQDREIRSDDTT